MDKDPDRMGALEWVCGVVLFGYFVMVPVLVVPPMLGAWSELERNDEVVAGGGDVVAAATPTATPAAIPTATPAAPGASSGAPEAGAPVAPTGASTDGAAEAGSSAEPPGASGAPAGDPSAASGSPATPAGSTGEDATIGVSAAASAAKATPAAHANNNCPAGTRRVMALGSQCLTPLPHLTWLSALSGMIGGALHGLGSIGAFLGNRTFRLRWTVWYLARPFVGALIGGALAVVPVGGLGANAGEVNSSIVLALGGLGGMFSSLAIIWLKRVFLTLLGVDEGKLEDKVEEKPGTRPGGGEAPPAPPPPPPPPGDGSLGRRSHAEEQARRALSATPPADAASSPSPAVPAPVPADAESSLARGGGSAS